jgi:hypothetical protein
MPLRKLWIIAPLLVEKAAVATPAVPTATR